ncbi:MAG: tRNA (adenosine(37)-N6)-threonylcarbamoyltransferase complex ATPase subunit type 1 TsaE [Chlamydiales bacterium]|nr:tRNA (adenosine(37)-N6)-threonylcarbamoyltransferase complex ATPase subunit type 1 TsaE [Chlamydiales bacterium]
MVRRSLNETLAFAKDLAPTLKSGSIVCFFGPLGAGKTTMIKTMIHALTATPIDQITSPTFNYVNSYGHIHHFDLYRLQNAKQFHALGFEEYFAPDSICLIEWSERIEPMIPSHAQRIHISIVSENERSIEYETPVFF